MFSFFETQRNFSEGGVTYKKTTPGSESDQDASGLVLVIQEYLPCLGKKMQHDQENQLGGFLLHVHPDRLACRHRGYQAMNGPPALG